MTPGEGRLNFMSRARLYAVRAHGDQRYGDSPYVVHLDAVVSILLRFGHGDHETVAAGYLHDVLEDTSRERRDLVLEFGEVVASLVDACTDGRGASRRERKERPFRLIPRTPGSLLVKLADRIANVESAARGRPGLLAMYRKEHPEFEKRLRGPSVAEPMWDHLRSLLEAR